MANNQAEFDQADLIDLDSSAFRRAPDTRGGDLIRIPDGALSDREGRAVDRAVEKALLLRLEDEIDEAALHFVGEIRRTQADEFAATIDFLRELRDVDRPPEDRENIRRFNVLTTTAAAEDLHKIANAGTDQIADIVKKKITMDDDRGKLARFFSAVTRSR